MEDRRAQSARTIIQVVLVTVITLGLYTYLMQRTLEPVGMLELIKGVVKFFILLWGSIPQKVWLVFLDLVLVVIFMLLSMAFFAQFGLPLRNLSQRIKAMLYLPLYYTPFRGPLARIDNGRLPENFQRQSQRGLGVIYLDTASAAVLRKPGEFTRSVGPGLVFARPDEYIAETVDLHRHTWPWPPFGPLGDEEDPFAQKNAKETDADYQERQARRLQTSGSTRDGIEVVPQIFSVCRFDMSLARSDDPEFVNNQRMYPEWGGNPNMVTSNFGYADEAVRRAVMGVRVDRRRGRETPVDEQQMPWYQLPAFMAVDLWREYLRKFSFEELFNPLDSHDPAYQDVRYSDRTALEVIVEMVRRRMQERLVDVIDAQGMLQRAIPGEDESYRPVELSGGRTLRDEAGNPVFIQQRLSREYLLLQDRGIQVMYTPIRDFRFPSRIEDQMLNNWLNAWQTRARAEREEIESLRNERQRLGAAEGQREFTVQAVRSVERVMSGPQRARNADDHRVHTQRILESLLRGTIFGAAADQSLSTRLATEIRQILEVIDWLHRSGRGQE